jgi:hypothetical protein
MGRPHAAIGEPYLAADDPFAAGLECGAQERRHLVGLSKAQAAGQTRGGTNRNVSRQRGEHLRRDDAQIEGISFRWHDGNVIRTSARHKARVRSVLY